MAATVMLSLLHASKTFLSRFALLFTLYCCLAFFVLFLSICIVSCMLPCLLVSLKRSLQFYPSWVLCFKPFCRVVNQVFPICWLFYNKTSKFVSDLISWSMFNSKHCYRLIFLRHKAKVSSSSIKKLEYLSRKCIKCLFEVS